jgi:DNA-binding CsgD family transcriptional regulator
MNIPDSTKKPSFQTGEPEQDHPCLSSQVLTAINMLNMGILVVDREARITFANCTAKDLLQFHKGAGVHAQPSTDTLQSVGALDRRLRQAISGGEGPAGGYLALPAAGDKRLIVLVVPCRSDEADAPGESSSILFVSDLGSDPDMDLSPIARLYELTPAETRLLEALVRGERVGEYAKQTGITLNTAKSHLKRLFTKTQTSRQCELVLRVHANPVFHLVSAKSKRSHEEKERTREREL